MGFLALLQKVNWYMMMCLSDWLTTYQFIRHGEWPAEVWEIPFKPEMIELWIRQRIDERRIKN